MKKYKKDKEGSARKDMRKKKHKGGDCFSIFLFCF
jgi:hypothetical protein